MTWNLGKGEAVSSVIDSQPGETDGYGRTLAHAYRFPDGLFASRLLRLAMLRGLGLMV